MITLSDDQLKLIKQHGEKDYPYECCGFLLGHISPVGTKKVDEIRSINNSREASAQHNRFLIDPGEFMKAESYARKNHCDIVGIYHSHPDHPAVPSQFDLEHAWPVYSYVIVAVQKGKAADLLSWEMRLDRSGFDAEKILTRSV